MLYCSSPTNSFTNYNKLYQPSNSSMNSPVVDAQQQELHELDVPQSQSHQHEVQVDMSNMVGKIKAAPVCVDATLRKEAMSAEELSKLTFPVILDGTPQSSPSRPPTAVPAETPQEVSVVSSGSSTGSGESALSDVEGVVGGNGGCSNSSSSSSRLSRKEDSERINLKVTTQETSRNGRQTQRWFSDPSSQRLYRMTTGCVPIVEGGKVLFVSSSRKAEWILPKGGWENDEKIEESAIRETFEEAGVLGILGPPLGEIEYETRKAKKRRLEHEEIQRKAKLFRQASWDSNSNNGSPKTTESRSLSEEAISNSDPTPFNTPNRTDLIPSSASAPVANEILNRIRGQASRIQSSDVETCSVASESSQSHTHVKMTLFPLYVTEIRDKWPEQGRFRKVVDIDEAIRITESRPEFQAALKELKERDLHLPQGDLSHPRGTVAEPK